MSGCSGGDDRMSACFICSIHVIHGHSCHAAMQRQSRNSPCLHCRCACHHTRFAFRCTAFPTRGSVTHSRQGNWCGAKNAISGKWQSFLLRRDGVTGYRGGGAHGAGWVSSGSLLASGLANLVQHSPLPLGADALLLGALRALQGGWGRADGASRMRQAEGWEAEAAGQDGTGCAKNNAAATDLPRRASYRTVLPIHPPQSTARSTRRRTSST